MGWKLCTVFLVMASKISQVVFNALFLPHLRGWKWRPEKNRKSPDSWATDGRWAVHMSHITLLKLWQEQDKLLLRYSMRFGGHYSRTSPTLTYKTFPACHSVLLPFGKPQSLWASVSLLVQWMKGFQKVISEILPMLKFSCSACIFSSHLPSTICSHHKCLITKRTFYFWNTFSQMKTFQYLRNLESSFILFNHPTSKIPFKRAMVTFYPRGWGNLRGLQPSRSFPQASCSLCPRQSAAPSISNYLQASSFDCRNCSTQLTLSTAFLNRDDLIFQRNPLMPFLRALSLRATAWVSVTKKQQSHLWWDVAKVTQSPDDLIGFQTSWGLT